VIFCFTLYLFFQSHSHHRTSICSSRTLTFVNVTNINRLEDLILVWFFTMNTMTGSTWMIFLYTRYETKLQHTHIQITIQHRIKYIFLNLYRYRYPTLNFSSFRLEFDYFAPEFIEASINILTLIFLLSIGDSLTNIGYYVILKVFKCKDFSKIDWCS